MDEVGLVAILKNAPTIATVIGGRIMPEPLPEGETLPALTYRLISAVPTNSMQGDSGLDFNRWQLTLWTQTALERQAIMLQLRPALRLIPQMRIAQPGMDLYEPVTKTYRRMIDIIVPGMS